jgi:hypothetical protein
VTKFKEDRNLGLTNWSIVTRWNRLEFRMAQWYCRLDNIKSLPEVSVRWASPPPAVGVASRSGQRPDTPHTNIRQYQISGSKQPATLISSHYGMFDLSCAGKNANLGTHLHVIFFYNKKTYFLAKAALKFSTYTERNIETFRAHTKISLPKTSKKRFK